jgi:hypothetical protein
MNLSGSIETKQICILSSMFLKDFISYEVTGVSHAAIMVIKMCGTLCMFQLLHYVYKFELQIYFAVSDINNITMAAYPFTSTHMQLLMSTSLP